MGITANTEEQTVERVEEFAPVTEGRSDSPSTEGEKVVTHHTLNSVNERVHCDGKDVWVCDTDERVDVDQFRAALDAIEAGAERVEFGGCSGRVTVDERVDEGSRVALLLYIGGRRRATNINSDIHDNLRDLLDAACE
ncbi:hypothetical protein HAPG_00073 [Halorubrum phage GNf2]|nr:hypothetical protein HAPG_00073 [Halorubrum phage GNf2]